ncbi:MAG: tRNA pseudouridine(55) synthase TruB [Alphaproteobacteria bacterium]|nr:tRNA pseudouridine(55) synthase TruB [Alphaproteobacteria bacterium]
MQKNTIDGWLAIDKPAGIGSTDVVTKLKHVLRPAKIGHAGTLDPLATGVLPIALGQATKLIPFVMDGAKEYAFEITWGRETTTDDLGGAVVQTSDKRPTPREIESALPAFTGTIAQVPPAYSAIKVDGRRAYDLARAGEAVVLNPRPVVVHELRLVSADRDAARFFIRCGKGTYVRAVAHDLGRALGCFGVVSSLRRTRCGPFREADTISLDFFEESGYNAGALRVLPLTTALDDILVLAVGEEQAKRLKQGQRIPLAELEHPPTQVENDAVLQAKCGMRLVALVKCKDGVVHPYRVVASDEKQ